MDYEDVSKVLLQNENITHEPPKSEPDLLNRKFIFKVNNREYTIIWYTNLMSLILNDGCTLNFTGFRVSKTWPNKHCYNLLFYHNDATIFIMPIE